MEPFFSPDGRYLFFNNENDSNVNTNLHFAERTGKASFRYLGELPGVNSDVLDAAPSVDQSGHFYFTTVRDYDRTMKSLYTADFNGKAVRNVHGDNQPGGFAQFSTKAEKTRLTSATEFCNSADTNSKACE